MLTYADVCCSGDRSANELMEPLQVLCYFTAAYVRVLLLYCCLLYCFTAALLKELMEPLQALHMRLPFLHVVVCTLTYADVC
jgi:hypothetical protein